MYILIVNAIPLGRALAAELVKNGHEVAYLDDNEEYCNMVATELGCLTILGETTSLRVLQEAGVARADVLLTMLEKDIKNIIVGLFGRQFHVPRIYARLNQEHYRSAYELAGVENVFSGFHFMLNNLLTAVEDPTVSHVMTLGDGRIEIAGIDVQQGSPFIGKMASALWSDRRYPQGALILGVLNNETQVFYPTREQQALNENDELFVAATHDEIRQIVQILNNRSIRRRK
jgi:trk system potassium uptake protein